MANSRTASVSIQVQGAAAAIDISQQLISLSYEENIRDRGYSLKLQFADPNLLFLSTFYIVNGSQIRAVIQINDWDSVGSQAPPLDCGIMYVDSLDMDAGRKGYVITLSATAIAPSMLRNEYHWTGTEGVSQTGQTGAVTKADGQNFLGDTTSGGAPQKRRDQDNESDLSFLTHRAHEVGDQIHVYNGQVVETNEANLEAQPPAIFLVRDIFPFINFKYKNSNIGCFAGANNKWMDTQTGKLLDNTVMAPNAPPGAPQMLNTSKRPPLTGQNNDPVTYPANEPPIDEGEPGTEGEETSGIEYGSGPGYNQNNTGTSPGEFLA